MALQQSDLPPLLSRATSEAQRGNLVASREAIRAIREAFVIERMPDVSAEVMIAEGVCEAYAGQLDAAYDRFRRATLVAHHFGSWPVEQLALSWLAHCEFNRGHPLESVKHVAQAHEDIPGARPDARFRISSTIAILCEYAGMTDAAAKWFIVARREAANCKEPALMSSIVYNMATLRIGSRLIGRLIDNRTDSIEKESTDLLLIQSSSSYDIIAGVSLQNEMHGLLKAYGLMVDGQYSAALSILNNVLVSQTHIASVDIARARFAGAWCELNLNIQVVDDSRLMLSLMHLVDCDDLALAHNTLMCIAEAKGDFEVVESQRRLLRQYLDEFLSLRNAIIRGLDGRSLVHVPAVWLV